MVRKKTGQSKSLTSVSIISPGKKAKRDILEFLKVLRLGERSQAVIGVEGKGVRILLNERQLTWLERSGGRE
jgi:hypothetical protein